MTITEKSSKVQKFKVKKDGSFVSLKMTADRSSPIMTEKQVCRVLTFDSNGAKSLHAPLPVNSLLGTFTSGQTNAGAYDMSHILFGVRRETIVTGELIGVSEILVFRLRMCTMCDV